MKRRWLALVPILLVIIMAVSSSRSAVNSGPKVIDPASVAYGRTYSEWSAAWEQWADSIPASHHPLFDNGNCSTGQSGPVWFLGGKLCPIGESCDLNNIVRNCTIPSAKALYFPVLNDEDSAVEERIGNNAQDPALQQIAGLRSKNESLLGSASASCTVDGVPIQQLEQKFRVQSPAFSFTLPADNLFTSIYGKNFPAGTYFPGVDDGWFVMLAPLSPGRHVVQFQGKGRVWTINVRYNLNVVQ